MSFPKSLGAFKILLKIYVCITIPYIRSSQLDLVRVGGYDGIKNALSITDNKW